MDRLETHQATVRERIASLKHELSKRGLKAAIIPTSDPHLSEYLPDHWKVREWASGFTGSAGTLAVTRDEAALFADSRYWTQAENQLAATGVSAQRSSSGQPTAAMAWLVARLERGDVVGVDGRVLGLATARQVREALDSVGAILKTDVDLAHSIWPDRPPLPEGPVFEHEATLCAQSRVEKIAALRANMKDLGAQWHFISTLDDVAWLLNLRGQDVPYNPIFVAHVLVAPERVTLFVDARKIGPSLTARLAEDGVSIAPYEGAAQALAKLPATERLLIDPRRITLGFREAVPASMSVIEAVNPTTLSKSRKGEVELANVRKTMEEDGAALAGFFAWLEDTWPHGRITELTVDEKLIEFRSRRPGFICPSFATIAGFNANGAMPHYRATEESHAVIEGNGMLLIDSGGQYTGGTTDITRVVPVGTPSPEQRRDFTLVLNGMIGLARAVFPRGVRSPLLDALARAPIWAAGVDYGHGTGHGVGYFLNVHEGPQSISPLTLAEPHTALEPGMITSDEPGIYRPGAWGVRIENLILSVPAMTSEFGEFLRFETLTLCPIDTRLVERAMMTPEEIEWLNAYHDEVRRRLLPLVDGRARDWLIARCEPIEACQ